MAYYTGVVSNTASLQSIIETQAVANGWTLTSGVLSKGNSYVKLTSPDTHFLNITGYTGAGESGSSGITRSLYFPDTVYPVTYFLFIWDNPDMVICCVQETPTRMEHLMFGDLAKLDSSAYIGGNFYYATCSYPNADNSIDTYSWPRLEQISLTQLQCGTFLFRHEQPEIIPFTTPGTNWQGTPIHAEIDSNVWIIGLVGSPPKVSLTDTTISSLFRGPNTWNQQAHLVPMNIQFTMADNLYGYLGYIEHIRLVRIDNYELGDLITISPDVWKVFPWRQKDSINRNGGSMGTSGTIGIAVRYS